MAFMNGTLDATRLSSIETHLTSCVSCRGHMMDLLQMSRSGSDQSDDFLPVHPYTFEAGEWVGRRYRVLATLGRGGMGEVYEAFDHLLSMPVALKTTIATRCDSRECVRRLLEEARLARRVNHPNVCRTYGVGFHDGDPERGERIAFLSMEPVAGEPLRRRLREGGPLSLGEAAALGYEILDGLSALHRAQVVHCDVKSDNIMVRTDAPVGRRAVIIDFGLAVAREAQREARSRGSSSTPEGTLAYMAPEQLAGRPVAPATDVYSFGATLYEMLTGRSPFSGRARVAGLPPPLPESLGHLRLGQLNGFFARCLHSAPEARFSDASHALRAFDRLW